ncbi:MAG TPA: glycosyltransferase [Candidatus Saccharimonadaceae bacterium]|jgi:glycosyltransferase involved in cell wall biosynthesis|nr:glycosyltransferase [Candidatus Saccharimonadaceae bacterium]
MSGALRVMHVIDGMRQGGAESLILEHVKLAGPGVESWVCALNQGGPALEAARALGAHAEVLGAGRMGRLWALAGRLRAARIDVVNGHNPTGGLYAAGAAMLAGVRTVFRTEHSVHYTGRHSSAYRLIEPLVTRRTAGVLCVCDAVRASHAPRAGRRAARFVTVLNGIEDVALPLEARATARAALGLGPDDELVLTVGSLTRQKAQHVLLDAFAGVARERPLARLAIAGEGALRETLEVQARALGLADRAHLLGPRQDVAALMAACDVFVLSSEREGLSVTLLESMRASRPAVVTRVGGNAEAVEDGVSGHVVAAGDSAALGEAIAALLGDPARREREGAAARARFLGRFTAQRMVRETEALYRLALHGQPVGGHAEGRHALA